MHVGIFGHQFPGLLAAMSTGIPVVAMLESTYDLAARSQSVGGMSLAQQWKWRSLYAGLALIARVARIQFVALSEAVKQSAIQHLHLPSDQIVVIPLGLIPEESDETLLSDEAVRKVKSELGLNGAYPILLNVARLSPPKGQKELLRFMPQVLKRFPQAKLLVAGDGPLLPELEWLRDNLGLREQVLLLGRRNDVRVLLSASDLFVFTSYYEGLPGAVIEAMSAGKPIVAFDIPSLRGVVQDGHSGVLVQERDVDKFAEAIANLAEHRDVARNMGERARLVVNKKYDIRQNMKSLEALYNQMLAQT
jgi:glycosyltransferase involved in cell wall biosynthesis